MNMHKLYSRICIDDNQTSQSKQTLKKLYYFIRYFGNNLIKYIIIIQHL